MCSCCGRRLLRHRQAGLERYIVPFLRHGLQGKVWACQAHVREVADNQHRHLLPRCVPVPGETHVQQKL